VQFSSSLTYGHAFHHSVFSTKGQMNASMNLQTLKCDREMHWLNFSNPADGWWQEEHTWPFGHGWARVHKLFVSPICWWGYGKHLLERFRFL
jgi:hypothetical protein